MSTSRLHYASQFPTGVTLTSSQSSGGEVQKLSISRLLEVVKVAVVLMDRDARVISLSPLSHPVFIQAREAMLGKTLWEVFPEMENSPLFSIFHDAVQSSLPLHDEHFYFPLSTWFDLHLVPSPEGWTLFVQNITERKQAEDAVARMAAIVASSDDAILSKTLDGTILSWNRGAERLYGYTAHEIIGHSVQTLVPLALHSELNALMKQLRAGERVEHFETVRIRKDGSQVEVSITISPVKNAAGHIIAASTIARDMTERKLLQKCITHRERQLQAIVDGSPATIHVKDTRGRYLLINQQAADLHHLTKEQFLGKTDDELFSREFAAPLQAQDRAVLASGSMLTQESVIDLKDGQHTYLVVKFPLVDEAGVPNAVCGISTDITERVQMEQRKDEFISMASHELRTPLTSLIGYMQLLQMILAREGGSSNVVKYLSRMDKQLIRMSKLITDMLDIARIQGGKLVYAEEVVKVDDMVRETVASLQPIIRKHCLLIEGTVTGEVIGDRDRLGQVLINLVNNAVKYSPEAEVVIVKMEESAETVTFSVQDFGIGIAPSHQEHIFERFYRVSNSRDALYPGLGLGLYLCHEIIEYHAGTIEVRSQEGQGSTFLVALSRKH